MPTLSLRISDSEEIILNRLARHFNLNQSEIVRAALLDMFEDFLDQEIIQNFEAAEARGETKWVSVESGPIDQDVLTWFKMQGNDYRARINAILRKYMPA